MEMLLNNIILENEHLPITKDFNHFWKNLSKNHEKILGKEDAVRLKNFVFCIQKGMYQKN